MTAKVARQTERVVFLGGATAVRGTPREFLHFGTTLVVHDDLLEAFIEVAREPESVLIISTNVSAVPLKSILELAVAMRGSAVILGLGSGDAATSMRVALAVNVRATVNLPLTPERLRQTVRSLPRPRRIENESVTVGGLTVDPARHHVLWHGVRIDMTPREMSVLHSLMQAHPYMASLEELAVELAGSATDPIGAIRVAIQRIRSRLNTVTAESHAIIETVRGVGYRLVC